MRQDSTLRNMSRFLTALFTETTKGMQFNHEVRLRLIYELEHRGLNIHDASFLADWDIFDKKLLRPRPRLISAVASYAFLTEQDYQKIVDQKGMFPFRALWAIGAIQDDLIDEINKEELINMPDNKSRIDAIRNAIFGKDKLFYQAAYSCIIDYLYLTEEFNIEEKLYLCRVMADWFRFLMEQEAEVFATPQDEYDFAYSKAYREQQDYAISRTLAACLNGIKCLDPQFQSLEEIFPKLSYRSQIIDDIGDTTEDLGLGRPSYSVGALLDNPWELINLQDFAEAKDIHKFTPGLLKKIAPRSYKLVRDAYAEYGTQLVDALGKKGKFLDKAGWLAYYGFPVARNVMHRVNDRYANF